MQPVYEFGGTGPVLNLALANGIPPATYQPLLKPFMQDHRVICLLPRAFWDGETPPDHHLADWRTNVGQDLLNGLREHDLRGVVAVGHSFGGVASLLAVIAEPERFKALILLDPTLFAPHVVQAFDDLRSRDAMDEFPLAARAIWRQRLFGSTEEAFKYFRSRPLFRDWSDEVVRLYAEQGTRPLDEADGVTLRWSPEWEAYYFKTGYTGTWDHLPALRGLVPTLIMRGTESDTYLAESAARVRELLPEATHVDLPGRGHLFPQEAPDETYQVMREWLDSLK